MIHQLNFEPGKVKMAHSDDCIRLAWLAEQAVAALIQEAELTPKPGLVDCNNAGSHTDMDVDLLRLSASALYPAFHDMAQAAFCKQPCQELREELARIGRRGEQMMLQATGGVNTHKGAIWALGLLIAGAAMLPQGVSIEEVANKAGEIASFADRWAPVGETNGSRMRKRFGIGGAGEEAKKGFPHVMLVALPTLWEAREKGNPEDLARIDALVMLISRIDDTCILHRGGMEALFIAKKMSQAVMDAGGTSTREGMQLLRHMDKELLVRRASPGGSADLLAAALFLDTLRIHSGREVHDHGNHAISI